MMIYLDHAAGSLCREKAIGKAMAKALVNYGANPGRGGHILSRRTGCMVEGVREQLAALFGIRDRRRLVFTAGATAALNQAIFGLLFQGGHAVCSSMEHNAVRRPLLALAAAGRCTFDLAQAGSDGRVTAAAYRARLRPDTKLLILNHGSNVNGAIQPLAEIAALARQHRIPLLVDAAQTAGLLPMDVNALHIPLLALPAHKGLHGPAGVGALYVEEGLELYPLISGGTGGNSEGAAMPASYPQHLEAGSLPVAAIAGWGAALSLFFPHGVEGYLESALALSRLLEQNLRQLPGLTLQSPGPGPDLPVLSCTFQQCSPQQMEQALDAAGICTRAGYHCSPWAHQSLNTYQQDGSLRFSIGQNNTLAEIRQAAKTVERCLRDF